MKIKLILICLFGTLLSMQAQTSVKSVPLESPGSVTGKVVDKTTNEPLPYVNVIVKEANKFITGGITSDKGIFYIKNLDLKNYTVEIQFMGYKTVTRSITLSADNKNADLKTLAIEEDAIQLKGVDIISEKSTIEQKIDRKIINVGKDLISTGATAGEIMNNIPSVSVDPQTNSISLRGNSNVRVLIDGKPSNIDASQLLQQIPSSSIKQIELITNPSAKYNPEGMSGIINIVLNKNSKIGFNGSINNGVTFGKTPKLNSSFDLNYRSGKFNFYGNYGLNTGKQANNGFIKSEELNRENTQIFTFNNNNTSHLAKVGFDFNINDNNTLSFYTNQSFFKGNGKASTDVDYTNNSTNTDLLQLFENKNDDRSQTYNFDYKIKFKKEGSSLELEMNYNKNDGPENAIYTNYNRDTGAINSTFTNDVETIGENTIINLDYVNPLTETIKLELGLEHRNETTDNSLLRDSNPNSNFSYDRKISSAYATLGKQWKKWSFQAGARLEQYNIEAQFKEVSKADGTFKDDLLNVYPSTFLTYNPSDKNSFNLSFSRRVDRPSIGQVNPIREWSTATLDSQGNPDLIPQFTNSYEINYTRKTKIGSITSGIFYRRIEDEITRVIFTNPENPSKQILSFDNFNDNEAYGIEVSGNLDFRKWWSANVSVDAYQKKVKGTIESSPGIYEFVEVNANTFNARINNTFKATKDLRFQLFGMYRGRDLSLQFNREAMWKMDVGTSYNVLKGSGTISARFSDIFNSMHFAFEGDRPYKSNGQFNWESQSVYLGFNYRFGSGKNKAIQRKQRDKNETQGGGGLL
ncbi:TonB-dependent receptor domain-containing protein [Flavobacterium degerlachei]|uniref:Outer membrane receptor proteins, mostly Fe transport n=1 Tax=Flavobacterium degerlachei TaxID=229203 RepID=A0A1H2W4P8_9FLAO|nr:TonB-dependent receptor [Flavobacterium degerlachei]SDW75214.1 Outer membrane receptor proteins, mostly Fe transport [Flavobacterium degerlachei]